MDLAPLATLPHLRKLLFVGIDEPVDLSPLAWTDHRLQMWLWNINGGTAGLLVKVRRR